MLREALTMLGPAGAGLTAARAVLLAARKSVAPAFALVSEWSRVRRFARRLARPF
jgi:hypothetical protein